MSYHTHIAKSLCKSNLSWIKIYSPKVLLIIFSYIDYRGIIPKFRLVCKAWENPAKTFMFIKPLHVYREEIRNKLIFHLTKNREKGRLIKNLASDHLYTSITQIVQRSLAALNKLTSAPFSYHLNGNYTKALLTFKESMSKLELHILESTTNSQSLTHRLDEFPNLKILNLIGSLRNILKLGAILKQCCHLQRLDPHIKSINELENDAIDKLMTDELTA